MRISQIFAHPGRLRLVLAAMPLLFGPGCQQEEPNQPSNVIAEAPGPAAAKAAGAAAAAAGGAPGAPADATNSALFGEAASRSRLVLVDGEAGGRGSGLVALGAPDVDAWADPDAMHKNGVLAGELVRQAMLIAARDELGLATRDAVLGEALPDSSGDSTLRLGSFVSSGNGTMRTNHAFVTRGEGPQAERLLVVDLPCPYSPIGPLSKLVEKAERLSRAEFPGLLRKLGADGRPRAARADAKVPAGVEDRISQLGLTGPFAAVRALHEAIRADGESPDRLAALARAYAMLGVQSQFQWHRAHKAYKARALLYAQRLAVREPKSARALWHRAYVEALIGMHRDAINDLAAAATAGGSATRPEWVGLVEALAHQDTKKLGAARGSQARLAALMTLLVEEYPIGTRQTLAAARQVLDLEPECFLAHDIICRIGGVANGHTATTIGPEIFARMLTGSLKAMPGLPATVRAFLDHPVGGDAAVFDRLEKAETPGNDRDEPSWAAMGHLLRETRFVQVYRRLHFMRLQWSVPVDEYWNEGSHNHRNRNVR